MPTPDVYAPGGPLLDRLSSTRHRPVPGLLRPAVRLDRRGGRPRVRRLLQLHEGRRARRRAAWLPADARVPNVWTTYLASDDAQKTVDRPPATGGEIVVPPMAVADLGTMAGVTDPGGAFIGIWQPGTHQGFGRWLETGTPGWFELNTRDYDQSLTFYREVFNWDTQTVSDTPEFRYTTHVDRRGAGCRHHGRHEHARRRRAPHWAVYFATDDADATAARRRAGRPRSSRRRGHALRPARRRHRSDGRGVPDRPGLSRGVPTGRSSGRFPPASSGRSQRLPDDLEVVSLAGLVEELGRAQGVGEVEGVACPHQSRRGWAGANRPWPRAASRISASVSKSIGSIAGGRSPAVMAFRRVATGSISRSTRLRANP